MSLYVKGHVLTSESMEFTRKDGSGKGTMYRSLIYDSNLKKRPVEVNTGERELTVGKYYRIPVYVNLYKPERGGETIIQYRTYKDMPPEEIKPS